MTAPRATGRDGRMGLERTIRPLPRREPKAGKRSPRPVSPRWTKKAHPPPPRAGRRTRRKVAEAEPCRWERQWETVCRGGRTPFLKKGLAKNFPAPLRRERMLPCRCPEGRAAERGVKKSSRSLPLPGAEVLEQNPRSWSGKVRFYAIRVRLDAACHGFTRSRGKLAENDRAKGNAFCRSPRRMDRQEERK